MVSSRALLKKYAKNYNCQLFFETGTYLGDMTQAVKGDFKHIYTVELSEQLYQQVQLRFQNDHHVTLIHGDSGKVIRENLKQIQEPCLFWLDAHYSGGITATGNKHAPIIEEINTILGHSIKNHVILIDDARMFAGKNGYPELSELKEKVAMLRPELNFAVKKDIIRIAKK